MNPYSPDLNDSIMNHDLELKQVMKENFENPPGPNQDISKPR